MDSAYEAMLIRIACLMAALTVFLLAKSIVTFLHHEMIEEVIDRYQKDCKRRGKSIEVRPEDMESFYITFLKPWCWSYKHILPKKKLKAIKDFIGKQV